MNAVTEIGNNSLVLPKAETLAEMFKKPSGLDALIDRLEQSVREEAAGLSPDTKKGREAMKSLAYKVSQSKAELDRQGLALTEQARKEIDAVNAGRKAAKDRLDALRDEAKQPALDWEAKEEARIATIRDRLSALDAGRADAACPSAQIADAIAEIDAIEIGAEWQEFQAEAEGAKSAALASLKSSLAVAEKREADERELEELRALRAAREEEDRKRREEEEAAAALKARADKAREYIREIEGGSIGGNPQPFGILIYELETKLPPLVDELGPHADGVHDARKAALAGLTVAMEKQNAEAEAKRKTEAEAAEIAAKEQAKREKEAAEKRHAEELAAAAQAERARIADEKRKEEEAAAKRAADQAHRDEIRSDIVAALSNMRGKATPEAIADVLMAGEIPHTEVKI